VRVALVLVPYDLGRERVGTGRGPEAYVDGGAVEALRERGHEVAVVTVVRPSPFREELDAVLAVNREVARAVAAAVASDRLPLVVAGNCNASLGLRAGLQAAGAPPDTVRAIASENARRLLKLDPLARAERPSEAAGRKQATRRPRSRST